MDMSGAIATKLRYLEEEGVDAYDGYAYDGYLEQQVALLLCVVADIPWASEILNHLGWSA